MLRQIPLTCTTSLQQHHATYISPGNERASKSAISLLVEKALLRAAQYMHAARCSKIPPVTKAAAPQYSMPSACCSDLALHGAAVRPYPDMLEACGLHCFSGAAAAPVGAAVMLGANIDKVRIGQAAKVLSSCLQEQQCMQRKADQAALVKYLQGPVRLCRAQIQAEAWTACLLTVWWGLCCSCMHACEYASVHISICNLQKLQAFNNAAVSHKAQHSTAALGNSANSITIC